MHLIIDAMEAWVGSMIGWLALPQFGLSTVFIVSFVSATLLPLGSEPAVFGLVKLNPEMFWPAVLVATLGNTLGGALSWWMGCVAEKAYQKTREKAQAPAQLVTVQGADESTIANARESAGNRQAQHERAVRWLERFGTRACLLSWLPIVGDPLCAVAGWLKLPFWPCVGYMAIGKFARYLAMTAGMLWVWPGVFPH